MLFATSVLAHAIGQSLNQKVDGYLVDVGYDSLMPTPVAGEPTLFDFQLYQSSNNNPVSFSEVVVDIGQEPEPITFYGSIKTKPEGPNTWIYTFPKGGTYKFRVRYKTGDESIAEAAFKLDVLQAYYEQPPKNSKKDWANFAGGAIVGILGFGLILGSYSFVKSKKRY